MCERIMRYSNFATHLAEMGVAVYNHDHLGHSGTSEEKEFIAEEDGDAMFVSDMMRVNACRGGISPGSRTL